VLTDIDAIADFSAGDRRLTAVARRALSQILTEV
jgi:hypothetical protein